MREPLPLPRNAWPLLGLLFVLLALAVAWLVQWETGNDLASARQAAESQLRSGSTIVAAELGKGDHQGIAALFDAWGRANPDLAQLRLTGADGQDIAAFTRPRQPARRLELESPVDAAGHGRARLRMAFSLDPVYRRRGEFMTAFGALLLALAALMVLLLRNAELCREHWLRALRMSRLYSALSEINQAIVRMERQGELFPLVCRCAVKFGGLRMAWIGLRSEEGDRVVPVAVQGDDTGYLDGLYISCRADVPEGLGPTGVALRENRAVIVNDFHAEPSTAPWRERAASAGWGASATFPITRGGAPFAVLTVYHAERGAFDGETIALLQEMVVDVGFALDNFDRESERRAGEQALRLAASVYEGSSEGILMADADNRIIAVNPAFSRITGRLPDEVVGRPLDTLAWSGPDGEDGSATWARILREARWSGELHERRGDGSRVHLWARTDTVYGAQGGILRRVFLLQDISQHKEALETIWRQANFDHLTGLPNRQMFRAHLRQELAKSDRSGGGLALLFLDLDRFQEVNQALGYGGADELLGAVAARLRAAVPDGAMLGRLGSDEFGIVLDGGGQRPRADAVADDILHRLAAAFRVAGEEVAVTCSIGIALFPGDAADDGGLMRHADQALHAAKEAGRNRYHFFTASMQRASQARLQTARGLRSALQDSQFRLHYQPIVALADGAVHKAEALVRWQHPEQGLVMPGSFIAIAEETGLICEIGDWVFREAARQAAEWRRSLDASFQISINTSPLQFLAPQRGPAEWPGYLERIGLPGEAVGIEITESVLLEASGTVLDLLHQLRDAGMRLSQDDFGSGYSSLSYLKRFDIDFVKIDQSFVRNLEPGSEDVALCEAIIAMAHALGIQVVAEGIETAFQRDLLAAAGCDFGQGYLFSHPLPPDRFAALVGARAPGSPGIG